MAKNTLLVLTRDQQEYKKRLHALNLPDLEILAPKTKEGIQEGIKQATIMLAIPALAKPHINEAKKVVWVQSIFTGIDALNDETLRKDYILTNVRDVYGSAMAEYIFAYILAFKKKVIENIEHQKQTKWEQKPQTTLESEVLAILGAGSIGKEIARIGKAFGMRVIGYRISNKPVEFFDEIYTEGRLKEFLSQGDYVVSVLPNTKSTTNIINRESISRMKKSAVFFNVGRGNAVDEDVLLEVIRERRIAKAVLDVFKTEPLSESSPLWNVENLYITPHISGYLTTDKEFEVFAENYRRFCAGEELKYQVDFKKGY